jgi:prepilin signal peptidase PulO-like enzyme (type II secretory pathway)
MTYPAFALFLDFFAFGFCLTSASLGVLGVKATLHVTRKLRSGREDLGIGAFSLSLDFGLRTKMSLRE